MKKIIIRSCDLDNQQLRLDFYDFFNIDVLGILDSIFSLEKREYLDYEDIESKILIGSPSDIRTLMRPNFLSQIIIDDMELKGNGEPIYFSIIVKEHYYDKDYTLFFDIENLIVEVQDSNKTKYIYKISEINRNGFLNAKAILEKEIFSNRWKGIKFTKIHTKNGKSSLEEGNERIKYHNFRYHYQNRKIDSLIEFKIENKKSIKSYSCNDFENGKIYNQNFFTKDILDSFMVSLKDEDIESSLMLYSLINDKLRNIPDKFNYEFKVTTKIKDSNLIEVINVKNGVINIETKESDKKLWQKKKVKN